MIIYFVRHGQTDWNKALRWQADSDIELNAAGREQAAAIRQWFQDQAQHPSAIVSSPRKRALATARGIASACGQEVSFDPEFRELSLGEFEGKTTAALEQEYGQVFANGLGAFHRIAAPGGENLDQGIERMYPALRACITEYGDRLVIVAHQGILMAMKAALSGDQQTSALAAYKQANYEIDVWDVDRACIQQRIDIREA